MRLSRTPRRLFYFLRGVANFFYLLEQSIFEHVVRSTLNQ